MEGLEGIFDTQGDIQYHGVLKRSLPIFEGESPKLCNWLTAWMQNYMLHLVSTMRWRLKYYNFINGHDMIGHNMSSFIQYQADQMVHGMLPVDVTWDTRKPLSAVGMVKEAFPQDAYLHEHQLLPPLQQQ